MEAALTDKTTIAWIDLAQEEAGEVIVACSKLKRFGATERNLADLQSEMTDLVRRLRENAILLRIPWREISDEYCQPKCPPEIDGATYKRMFGYV